MAKGKHQSIVKIKAAARLRKSKGCVVCYIGHEGHQSGGPSHPLLFPHDEKHRDGLACGNSLGYRAISFSRPGSFAPERTATSSTRSTVARLPPLHVLVLAGQLVIYRGTMEHHGTSAAAAAGRLGPVVPLRPTGE